MGIYDKQGALQAQYVYDTWGKVVSVQDADGNEITDPNHIGHANPIRYRGYYYDNETGYYYLQTRFYNPEWSRFLNADALVSTGQGILGYNMFAYCNNNPESKTDFNGECLLEGCAACAMAENYYKNSPPAVATTNPPKTANKPSTTYKPNTTSSYPAAVSKTQSPNLKSASLPRKGKPNSKDTLYNPDGTPKQERWYGPDGEPVRDRDYNHGGENNHEFPHDHVWENGRRGPAIPIPKPISGISNTDIGTGLAIGAGAVGTGYVIYRGIRMLPSLLPPLWWTIPANVAIP